MSMLPRSEKDDNVAENDSTADRTSLGDDRAADSDSFSREAVSRRHTRARAIKDIHDWVVSLGFTSEDAEKALKYNPPPTTATSTTTNQQTSLATPQYKGLIVDWLYLNVPEDRCPSDIKVSKFKLDMIDFSDTSNSHTAWERAKRLQQSVETSKGFSEVEKRLKVSPLGFSQQDISLAVKEGNGEFWKSLLLLLKWNDILQSKQQQQQQHQHLVDLLDEYNPEIAADELAGEVMAVEAIFGDAACIAPSEEELDDKNALTALKIQLEKGGGGLVLNVLIPKDSKYPFEPPLFLLDVNESKIFPKDSDTNRRVVKEINQHAAEICSGAPLIHEIYEWVKDSIIPRFKKNQLKKKQQQSTKAENNGSTIGNNKAKGKQSLNSLDSTAASINDKISQQLKQKYKQQHLEQEKKKEDRYEQAKRLFEEQKRKEEAELARRVLVKKLTALKPQHKIAKVIKLLDLRKSEKIHLKKTLENHGINVISDIIGCDGPTLVSILDERTDRKIREAVANFLAEFEINHSQQIICQRPTGTTSAASMALLKSLNNNQSSIQSDSQQSKPSSSTPAGRPTSSSSLKDFEPQQKAILPLIHTMPKEWKQQRERISASLKAEFKKRQRSKPYLKMRKQRENLPSFSRKEEIVKLVESNQVVVISGATGCGKSTQVPQFLLDHQLMSGNGGFCNIVCTQPRRIAAIGVAERVAQERAENIGQTVGYSIRLEAKRSSRTRLLFCTTGILLRNLENDPELKQGPISHIIVDEVHERSIDSDFLLIVLKDLLRKRPNLKLVLMSATLNAALFSEYFDGCAVMDIPGRTFPVERFYLEDAIQATAYFCESNSPYAAKLQKTDRDRKSGGSGPRTRRLRGKVGDVLDTIDESNPLGVPFAKLRKKLGEEYKDSTIQCLLNMDLEKINYDLLAMLIKHIVRPDQHPPHDGSVLVFLTGFNEIKTLVETLTKDKEFCDPNKFWIVPLHSMLSSEDQKKVFKTPPPGVIKIVVSTNIAETSVTINDCTVVVDCGKMKETQYDSNNNMSCLVETPVSKANASQRAGRAGRVRAGVCYHLFPTLNLSRMLAQPIPEMHRAPLESICLRIKILQLGSIHTFLEKALEPPSKSAVDNAVNVLVTLNALAMKRDKSGEYSEELTPLGYHLAQLPVDARIGKMMIYGCVFRCLDPCLTIAASMAHRSPFMSPFDKREEADKIRRNMSNFNLSDHLTLLKAYQGWTASLKYGSRTSREYLKKHFLSYNSLSTIRSMKSQFRKLLANIGFIKEYDNKSRKVQNSRNLNSKILWEERRIDPTDGQAYTQASFLEEYGTLKQWESAKVGPPLERRVDPADGRAYTKQSFLDTYNGLDEWNLAGKVAKQKAKERGSAALKSALSQEIEAQMNQNGGNLRLIRALLVAGLYPNVVRIEGKTVGLDALTGDQNAEIKSKPPNTDDVKLISSTGAVEIHPASVLWGESRFRYPFLIYHEKVKTSKVYLRDATMITPYSLLLFGGNIKVEHTKGHVVVDRWIKFNVPAQHAVLINKLRQEINGLLQRKITEPSYDAFTCDHSNKIVDAVAQLMKSER